MNRNVTWWIFWIQRYKSDVFLTPESVLLLMALVGRFLCVRTMHEVPDTQALRVYPVAVSLPHNPEGKRRTVSVVITGKSHYCQLTMINRLPL